jgi:hypothetical protein
MHEEKKLHLARINKYLLRIFKCDIHIYPEQTPFFYFLFTHSKERILFVILKKIKIIDFLDEFEEEFFLCFILKIRHKR